jgi:bidirectional [NiFe] hydrogenase diaphorase subunit
MSDRKQLTITIDDRELRVKEGTTILEAASLMDIIIPTLCHHKELSPSGACRLCIVEISRPAQNSTHSWVDSACVCPVSEGLHIRTDSPRIMKERKLILELLLSRAPDSPRIRELALEYGIAGSRYTAADKGQSKCILCGLCVRVCNELIKADAIGFAQRGINKELTSPYQIAASLCIGCLACVRVCPTGVIEFEIKKKKLKKEDWGVALEMIFCSDCGQPVGTRAQMKRMKEQITVIDELLNNCPACRRKRNYLNRIVMKEE